MPAQLHFLQAALPLCKVITPTVKQNYPLVKNFTSYATTVDSTAAFHDALQIAAARGECLIKGELSQPLIKQSRSGMAPRDTPTSWVCIDIDGIQLVDGHKNLRETAERIVKFLPVYWHDVSYVVHASASFGLTPNIASLHFFFLLDQPIAPSALRRYLAGLNFRHETLLCSTSLHKTGWGLKLASDACVADNGHLIYIAPPTFNGMADPFTSPDQRFVHVVKNNDTVSMIAISDDNSATFEKEKETRIKVLRKQQGLTGDRTAKIKSVAINGVQQSVLMNPSRCTLTPAYTARGFCYYNINGGDSSAYYHPIGKPDYIYSFKDEPTFRWMDADPDSYTQYIETNKDEIEKANPVNVFVVINGATDQFTKVYHNRATNEVRLIKTSRDKIGDFYAEHGKVPPDIIETWVIEYNPPAHYSIDYAGKKINTFVPSIYMQNAAVLEEQPVPLVYGNAATLSLYCPTISAIINHAMAYSAAEVNHFINWLAFIVQFRDKTKTCWFLWGAEGTGKGLITDEIMSKVLGAHNMSYAPSEAFGEKYNNWRANTLLVISREFQMPQGIAGDRMAEKIRESITDEIAPIREMGTDWQKVRTFESYIFCSNMYDMVRVKVNERRSNIAPRQETKLEVQNPSLIENLIEKINDELQIFTNYLVSWNVAHDHVRRPLDNTAKQFAHDMAASGPDSFRDALITGNIDYFIPLLHATGDEIDASGNADRMQLETAKSFVRAWLTPGEHYITPEQLCTIYNTMHDTKLSSIAFGKMMGRKGLVSAMYRIQGKLARHYKIRMKLSQVMDEEEIAHVAKLGPVIGVTVQ